MFSYWNVFSCAYIRYGKGWSVGYAVDLFADTVTFIFSLAVAGAQAETLKSLFQKRNSEIYTIMTRDNC